MKKRRIIGLAVLLGLGVILWMTMYRYAALIPWGVALAWLAFRGCAALGRRGHKLPGRIWTVLLVLVLAAALLTGGLVLSGSRGAGEAGYVLVLGAGVNGTEPSLALTQRLEAALAYLQAHPQAQCIVSGGMGQGEQITEARCMFNWLTRQGVAPARIWLEEQATSTWENLAFTLALIQENTGRRPETLAVVSSEYHLYRAGLMARQMGVQALGVPANTYPVIDRIYYTYREILALWGYWIFGMTN